MKKLESDLCSRQRKKTLNRQEHEAGRGIENGYERGLEDEG